MVYIKKISSKWIDRVERVHNHQEIVSVWGDVQTRGVVRRVQPRRHRRCVNLVVAFVEDMLVGVLAVGEVIDIDRSIDRTPVFEWQDINYGYKSP